MSGDLNPAYVNASHEDQSTKSFPFVYPPFETVRLVRELLSLLEIVETTDDGREFRPNQLGSCRVIDGFRINEILTQLRQIVDRAAV